jgi:hypothetical protein
MAPSDRRPVRATDVIGVVHRIRLLGSVPVLDPGSFTRTFHPQDSVDTNRRPGIKRHQEFAGTWWTAI